MEVRKKVIEQVLVRKEFAVLVDSGRLKRIMIYLNLFTRSFSRSFSRGKYLRLFKASYACDKRDIMRAESYSRTKNTGKYFSHSRSNLRIRNRSHYLNRKIHFE